MAKESGSKIWKVRTVKNYPDAHNHVFVGEVLGATASYVRLDCRTFHFGRNVNSLKEVKMGGRGVRIVPWARIELINELPGSFDFAKAELDSDGNGNVILVDGVNECRLASSFDSRY